MIINNKVEHFFISKILDNSVFCLGDYQLNSGANSKFYYDFSKISNAKSLYDLGFVIYETINSYKMWPIDVIFGAAYKGIPLAVSAVNYIFMNSERKNMEWAFDRKEPKLHGEKGLMVGANLENKNVLIIDDVITSGKALQRSFDTVMHYNPKSIRCLALIDRRENPNEELDFAKVYSVTTHKKILEKYTGE